MPFCYDYLGRGPFDEPAGRDVRGYDELARIYDTASGNCLLLSASETDLPRFAHVEGLESLADVPKAERAGFLAGVLKSAPAETWLSRLNAADIGAAVCETVEAIRTASARPADDAPGTGRGSYSFSVYRDHPSGHVVTQLDPYAIRPARGKVYAVAPAEKYGASTRTVLRTLGYTEAQIDGMIAVGAISEGWSREYLPS
jgi:crotonobetainyl-CoA:carnitine CoA-transferase CaiB-like acyl-CoA transferase